MRTANRLGMRTCADTMLRIVKNIATEQPVQAKIIGVDDWAWKKGQRYGTIIVDLEKRKPIDLLPECSSESLAAWLKKHPGVEVISRDRAEAYAEGSAQGAPSAIQVADRWHLIGNFKDAVGRFTQRHWSDLYKVLTVTVVTVQEGNHDLRIVIPPPAAISTRREELKQMTRDRRLARYNEVIELHHRGMSSTDISRNLNLDYRTVLKYIHSGSFPERAQPPSKPSLLDPFLSYLHQRWESGCHNGARLFRELCARGYTGRRTIVSGYIARLRRSQPADPSLKESPVKQTLSWRNTAWMLLKNDPSEKEAQDLEKIQKACPEVAKVRSMAQAFMEMIRERKLEALDSWLKEETLSEVKEMKTFAASLEKDKDAVESVGKPGKYL